MLVTPVTPVNISVGVKRGREMQGTHEEKVREQDLLRGKFDEAIGGIRAPP